MRSGWWVTVLVVVALASATSAPARASSSGGGCSSYPTPGSIAPAGTRTPADLVAEYGVLGQPQTAADKLTKAELGKALWASGVIMSGTRFLAVTATGVPVYLVPAEHLLAFRLAPDRCFSPAQRSLEQTLRPYLRREYAHHALCLLTLYAGNSTSTCSAAPGIADAFVDGPGNPGFGLAPNGVSNVLVQYVSQPSLSVAVQRNFWVVDTIWASGAAPCGVDWLNGAVVLRTVKRC